MMDFSQQLIIFLILLVGSKDLVMAFMRKQGWINGADHKGEDLMKEMKHIEENHIVHLEASIKELKDGQEKMIELLTKIDTKLDFLKK